MTSNEYLSPFVSLEREDLHKAWEGGCPDVRKALRILYPRDLPPKAKEVNITDDIKWKTMGSSEGSRFLEGFYGDEQVVYVNPTGEYREDEPGIQISYGQEEKYKVVHCGGHTFKIIKTG